MSSVVKAIYQCDDCFAPWERYWKDYAEPEECPLCHVLREPRRVDEIKIHVHVKYEKGAVIQNPSEYLSK